MLNKDTGTPLHSQLTNLIRQQIYKGELAVGEQLPSERELCQLHGVSRITVRKALSELTNEGLIYTVTGKGSYVAAPRFDETLHPLHSFTEDMLRRGTAAASKILEAAVIPAAAEQARLLDIPIGEEVVVLHRLRLAESSGVPIAIQRAWLPHDKCPGLLAHDLETGSLYHVLRNMYQINLVRGDTDISAALAAPEECELLQIAPPAAVLISQQTTYNDAGEVIEFTRSTFRGDLYTLHARM